MGTSINSLTLVLKLLLVVGGTAALQAAAAGRPELAEPETLSLDSDVLQPSKTVLRGGARQLLQGELCVRSMCGRVGG